MRKVLLVHTGGTLGMKGRRPNALTPGAFFETLQERVPELFRLAKIELELFSNFDSSEMQPEMWTKLARGLFKKLKAFDGAVITHGTDTLPYTAAALSFMLPNVERPVVLTGAQRPLHEVRSDARLNLIDAVTAALNGPREVTVCFDSHLYRGNRIRKVAVSEYDAFDSPNYPKLGVLGVDTQFEDGIKWKARPLLLPELEPRVFVLKVFPGLEPILPLMVLPHVRGVVVEAHGAGNFPVTPSLGRSLLPLFEAAKKHAVPVVVVSQAHRNGVDLSLYEAGAAALKLGAISGGDMTQAAATVKLMHGLAYFQGSSLKRYLERNVAGERS
jgi:L-asparaginase